MGDSVNVTSQLKPKVSYRKGRPAPPPPPPVNQTTVKVKENEGKVDTSQRTGPTNTDTDAPLLCGDSVVHKEMNEERSCEKGSDELVPKSKEKSVRSKLSVVKPSIPPPAPPFTKQLPAAPPVTKQTPAEPLAKVGENHQPFLETAIGKDVVRQEETSAVAGIINSSSVTTGEQSTKPSTSTQQEGHKDNTDVSKDDLNRQSDGNHNDSIASKLQNIPHKNLKRKTKRSSSLRQKYGLPLCCGLRNRRSDSPYDLELPNRTECALPDNKLLYSNYCDISDRAVVLPGGESQCSGLNIVSGKPHLPHDDVNTSCVSRTDAKPTIQNVRIVAPGQSPVANRLKYSSSCNIQDKRPPFGSRLGVVQTETLSSEAEKPDGFNSGLSHKRQTMSETSQRTVNLDKRYSRSTEDFNFIMVDLDLDLATRLERNKNFRSSFIGEDVNSKPPVFQSPGDFQTLLKHSKADEESVYVLPQPYCHGENTLKAVKRITEKYDTLERWKLKAYSFNQDTLKHSPAGKQLPLGYTDNKRRNSDKKSPTNETIVESREETDGIHCGDTNSEQAPSIILSKLELQQIEMFYKSRDSQVIVSNCTADLMFGNSNQGDIEWEPGYTGVPALLLNCGNERRGRELRVVFADRHTSFTLWQDRVNHLSHYTDTTSILHTMHLSTCHIRLMAFKFHCPASALTFLEKYKQLTADPNDELWKVSSVYKHKVLKHKGVAQKGTLVKGNISQPFNFSHINSIESSSNKLSVNFSQYVPEKRESTATNEMRQRAYSG